MVFLDRFIACHARKDQLAAAAVTGKEVGGDAIDHDDLVCFYRVLVQPYRCAAGRVAYVHQFIHGFAAMLIQFDTLCHFFADDCNVFFRRLFAVGALGKEDAHIFIGDAGEIQFVHDVDHILVGMIPSAGDVGAHDAHLVAFGNSFLQRFAADGVSHTVDGGFLHVTGRHRISFQYIGNMFLRQHDFLRAFAKSKFKFFQCHRCSSF